MFKQIVASSIFVLGAQAGSSLEDAGPFVNETWYSGLIDIDHKDRNQADDIFYWWFESRGSPKDDPVVLWLTGGPGCASEIALFYENGPYMFEEDGKTLKSNPYSWNANANLIYVDQPVGTGFSHSSIPHLNTDETQISENMAQFLIKFLEVYPQLQGKDFYITGESYAGHYIPAIAHSLVFIHKDQLKMKFKGMAIGNGLVSPYDQYPAYATFAQENNLVNKFEFDILKGAYKGCQLLIKSGVWLIAEEYCEIFTEVINGTPLTPRFNVYDIREKCEKPPLCYDMSPADNLLADESIKKILGVSGRKWAECTNIVHIALIGDWIVNLGPKVADLLHEGLDVLVYSGDKDFICNWRGGEAWTNALNWEHKAEYAQQDYQDWKVGDKASGSLKTYKNLKFLRVFDAGHMVPMNQPKVALQMLQDMISGGKLENDFIN